MCGSVIRRRVYREFEATIQKGALDEKQKEKQREQGSSKDRERESSPSGEAPSKIRWRYIAHHTREEMLEP